jgi:hypothetical protein
VTLAAQIVGLIVYFGHMAPPPDVLADMTAVLGAGLGFLGAFLAPHFPAAAQNGNDAQQPAPPPAPPPPQAIIEPVPQGAA